jgi:triosephosphate isomerase (TIM)
MEKKKLVVANWKMNPKTLSEAQELASAVRQEAFEAEVVLCPPYPFIASLKSLGAQDCGWEQSGAYTGEVSPAQLKDLGCEYVILGHSERKKYFGETREMVNKKAQAAMQAGLTPVMCIGENIEQEMEIALVGTDPTRLVLVYEPEWAISTAEHFKEVTPEDCKIAVDAMRKQFEGPILYGGSVDSRNVARFFQRGGVQGVLVGSASLDAHEFIQLVKNAVLA